MSKKGAALGGTLQQFGTPSWVVDLLVVWLEKNGFIKPGDTWGEPCAGLGQIIQYGPRSVNWLACEPVTAYHERLKNLRQLSAPEPLIYWQEAKVIGTDYTDMTRCDVMATNPPFTLTEDIVRDAVKKAPLVCILQRINFLGSAGRCPTKNGLWKTLPPNRTLLIPDRPIFRLNKEGKPQSDSCEYAWYLWNMDLRSVGAPSFIGEWLPHTDAKVRKASELEVRKLYKHWEEHL